MFICPKCRNELQGFYPEKCDCGYETPIKYSIYQFTDEQPISLEKEGHRYLGYENVGENYEGSSDTVQEIIDLDFGIFGNCSRKLVEILGKSCVVLDIGAGLGATSMTLALSGAKTICADISQKMLTTAVKRASDLHIDKNLVFARMNAYNLLLSDNSVDAVVAIDVLHQLDNPEVAVKEIIRVLKPDGVFIQYGCEGLPVTEEQANINIRCNEVVKDIRNYYNNSLTELGYQGPPYSSWDKVNACFEKYFEQPEKYQTDYDGVWKEKAQKEIHKIRTRASGSAQMIPDEIHNEAWKRTDEYAMGKYGNYYMNTPGYSRFTGFLETYKVRIGD